MHEVLMCAWMGGRLTLDELLALVQHQVHQLVEPLQDALH
jgi:hypothetical protein